MTGMTPATLLRAVAVAAALTLTTTPAPVQADTLCEDGWMSPSDGGPGTCSWHGGIAGNDNDGGGWGGGWSLPGGEGSDGIDLDEDLLPILLYGGGALWVASVVIKTMRDEKDNDKK